MKTIFQYSFLFILFYACGGKEKPATLENLTPSVADNGNKIIFPSRKSMDFFETETTGSSDLNMDITAPAKVSATVVKSEEGASQNIVLFENAGLAGNYTQLTQHLININQIQNINIRQKETELSRVKDLQEHGAATGKDLLEAQTNLAVERSNLANEKAAIIEHETGLKAGGFEYASLKKAAAGTAYIICDIPENMISRVQTGGKCTLRFTSFGDETFEGKIEGIADMIDQSTRMIKLRVSINNQNGKLKAGMFATVSFGINEGTNISVNKNALITIQAKNYVFVKTDTTTFERREISAGDQINDRIIIYSGLKNGEAVAVKGAMQLKGLSFGY